MCFLLNSLYDNKFTHTIHGVAMSQTRLSSITTTMTLNIYNSLCFQNMGLMITWTEKVVHSRNSAVPAFCLVPSWIMLLIP